MATQFPPPAPPSLAQATAAQTDGLAIASLVLGILAALGLVFYGVFGIIFGAIAIVLGLVSRGRIKKSGGALSGQGLATAGWILGVCAVVIGVAVIAVVVGLLFAWSTTTTTR